MTEIVITEFMDQAVVDDLRAEFDVHWDCELWNKTDECLALMANARAIAVRNRTEVNRRMLDAAPNLQVVARLGVGLDNIDIEACKRRGIEVCPAIGANAVSVAEYVIATAMILLRGRALRSTSRLAAGKWPRQELGHGREIAGKTLGIVGFGSIGQATGERGRAMAMEVMAHDLLLPEDARAWANARSVSLTTLVSSADVITLHCPLTPETRGLIGAAQFEQMKPGAILINAARGGIVDEPACAAALACGHLGGAALDTFQNEPIQPAAAKLFEGLPNIILSPHIAGITEEANKRISEIAAQNMTRVLRGSR